MLALDDAEYYRLRLPAARDHGERVYCEVVSWHGPHLARVRVISSTLPEYRFGQSGLVKRDRLIAVRPRRLT